MRTLGSLLGRVGRGTSDFSAHQAPLTAAPNPTRMASFVNVVFSSWKDGSSGNTESILLRAPPIRSSRRNFNVDAIIIFDGEEAMQQLSRFLLLLVSLFALHNNQHELFVGRNQNFVVLAL